MHLTNAISFLHKTAKIAHLDISPQNVYITPNGTWKIAGFGFALPLSSGEDQACSYFNKGVQIAGKFTLQPYLPYCAPELTSTSSTYNSSSDMWSLGCLTWSLFTLGQKEDGTLTELVPVDDNNPLTHQYKSKAIFPLVLDHCPEVAKMPLRRLIEISPINRISADEYLATPFFDSGPVHTMKTIETLLEQDVDTQINVLSSLYRSLEPFPISLLQTMILSPIVEVYFIII